MYLVCILFSESKDSRHIVRIFSKAGIKNELCRKVEISCGIREALWCDIILNLNNHQNEPQNPEIQLDSLSRILHGPAIASKNSNQKSHEALMIVKGGYRLSDRQIEMIKRALYAKDVTVLAMILKDYWSDVVESSIKMVAKDISVSRAKLCKRSEGSIFVRKFS